MARELVGSFLDFVSSLRVQVTEAEGTEAIKRGVKEVLIEEVHIGKGSRLSSLFCLDKNVEWREGSKKGMDQSQLSVSSS